MRVKITINLGWFNFTACDFTQAVNHILVGFIWTKSSSMLFNYINTAISKLNFVIVEIT